MEATNKARENVIISETLYQTLGRHNPPTHIIPKLPTSKNKSIREEENDSKQGKITIK